MVVKTFRGLLADDTQERLKLQTSAGKVGYRIVKFQVIGYNPGIGAQDSVMKIYKASQTSVNGLVNFSDNDLLGAAYWQAYGATAGYTAEPPTIIFETEIFNQDIYVTHEDVGGNALPCNYYLELEVIPLASAEAAITTVKAMRGLAVD